NYAPALLIFGEVTRGGMVSTAPILLERFIAKLPRATPPTCKQVCCATTFLATGYVRFGRILWSPAICSCTAIMMRKAGTVTLSCSSTILLWLLAFKGLWWEATVMLAYNFSP